jgi:hypothetical protein
MPSIARLIMARSKNSTKRLSREVPSSAAWNRAFPIPPLTQWTNKPEGEPSRPQAYGGSAALLGVVITAPLEASVPPVGRGSSS